MQRSKTASSTAAGPVAGFPAARLAASHFSVIVKGKGQVLVAGPAVVERALGVSMSKEELGGHAVHLKSGVVDNAALDEADALDMLARLSGRTHQVLTGVAVWDGQAMRCALSSTDVRFREIGPDEALAYWQSGEPADKAGAYAIQGRGGVFVCSKRDYRAQLGGSGHFEADRKSPR